MVVGRAEELEALAQALQRAADAVPTPLLLVGDPGVGKSILLRSVSSSAREAGFRVLAAACPDGSHELRYGALADLVHPAADLLATLADADRVILEGLSERGSPGPARVATALLRLLSAADASSPVAVVVDDLHAADTDSIAAITLAAGRLAGRRVAIVAAVRGHPATDPRLGPWERIVVGPLEADAATELLVASMPQRIRPSLTRARARTLADALGRNPTALRECPRLLTEEEVCGTAPLPDPVPVGERLLSAWGHAFDALTRVQQDAVLATYLTAGQGGHLLEHMLRLIGATDEDAAAGALVGLVGGSSRAGTEPLAGAGQPLVRSAVLTWAGPARVRAIHRRAAQAAAELGFPPPQVIAHLRASASGPEPELAEALEHQAELARARGQVRAAARAIETAAVVSESPSARAQLAARSAQLQLSVSQFVDDPGALLTILDSADLDPEGRIWADLLRAQHLMPQDVRGAAVAMRRAAGHAHLVNSPALPQILIGASFLAWAVGDGRAALDLADLFLEWEAGVDWETDMHAGAAPVPPWAGTALRGIARFQAGDVGSADDDLAAARAASAEWSPHSEQDLPLLVNVVMLDEALGTRRALSDRRLDIVVQGLEGDTGETIGIIRNIQASRALRRGDLTTARILVDEGLDIARAALHGQNILLRLCTAVRIDAIVGDRQRLTDEVAELRALAERLGHGWGHAYADRAEALLALADGRHADAVSSLTRLTADLLLGMGPADPVPMGRADLAEALLGAGDVLGAQEVVRRLVALLAESSDPAARGLIARVTGLVSSGPEGLRALRRAVDHWQATGEAFEVARTRLLLGERLQQHGQHTLAQLELRSSATAFDLMGAEPWRARALTALGAAERKAGLAPEPAEPPGETSLLTAAELRVAQAVATGATNKQAAEELCLSPRTVEHHLASVYRKLGVRTRTALVARLGPALADARVQTRG